MVWTACVITLFPEAFPGALGCSLAEKAKQNQLWDLKTIQLRDFATDNYGSVDDEPFGGGVGMILRPDIVDSALHHALKMAPQGSPIIYLSPRGAPLTQEKVRNLSTRPGVILLCGRYEGVDERVLQKHQIEEVSIGDYVLAGGEVAAQVLIEACIRLLPGVMGKASSADEESFSHGLLEYPQYTRPSVWENIEVPEVLRSGHHKKITTWRHQQAEDLTRTRRPDLWQKYKK